MISVIGTPRIQSNIERIMVSFMSCNKIIRYLPMVPELLFRFFFGDVVSLLDFAGQSIALSGNDVQTIAGEFAPSISKKS